MSILDLLARIRPSDLDAIPVVTVVRKQVYPCSYCGTDLRGLMAICTRSSCRKADAAFTAQMERRWDDQ